MYSIIYFGLLLGLLRPIWNFFAQWSIIIFSWFRVFTSNVVLLLYTLFAICIFFGFCFYLFCLFSINPIWTLGEEEERHGRQPTDGCRSSPRRLDFLFTNSLPIRVPQLDNVTRLCPNPLLKALRHSVWSEKRRWFFCFFVNGSCIMWSFFYFLSFYEDKRKRFYYSILFPLNKGARLPFTRVAIYTEMPWSIVEAGGHRDTHRQQTRTND